MAKVGNGRVGDISTPATEFSYYEDQVQNRPEFDDEATKGIHTSNEVSKIYFSSKNIEALQHGIRYGVYKKTCGAHTISNQSVDELKVIMRSIYLQYCENLPYDVLEQVRSLNGRVLDFAVDNITKELQMYSAYRRDQQSLPMPMERSTNVNSKGSKNIEFKAF
jgi:hypothetical protein